MSRLTTEGTSVAMEVFLYFFSTKKTNSVLKILKEITSSQVTFEKNKNKRTFRETFYQVTHSLRPTTNERES